IELGSGGAGAGGGGRSFYLGTDGENGGSGGGLVFLRAFSSLEVSGIISVRGNDGGVGGNGGSGDATADCCSDPCNGCDERTFSSGSGAGSGAGGGSGGGIFIESYGPALISGILDVSGGDGGDGGSSGVGVTCTYTDFFCGDQDISTGDAALSNEGGAGGGGRIKLYVSDCSNLNFNGTATTNGGMGNGVAEDGTYEEVCGYLGLEEGEISIGWSIYPNPFVDEITIEVLSGIDFWESNSLQIFNSLGQEILSKMILGEETTVNMSDYPAGMYTVRIISKDKVEMKKVLKKE
ncbi:MAG: T9SS type A sorting domain-containing protein, partial [Crocinitomicaceae bacterium]|nr:T9SS type A sorting domain-containing protein [Crocinitomicaceae bacterium]